jgi:RES domain-containing protein
MAATRIEIPDKVLRAEVARTELPADLTSAATIRRCRELGDAWLAAGRDLVLTVPSVIVPRERNVLINPTHPQMNQIRIASTERFRFDPRLAAAGR